MSTDHTACGGRGRLMGCSYAALMLGMLLSGTAAAASASDYSDPDVPIPTNRYGRSDRASGGPGLDLALSSSTKGVSADVGALLERLPPRDAFTHLTAETPARLAAPETGTGAGAGGGSGLLAAPAPVLAMAAPAPPAAAAPPPVQSRQATARVYTPLDVGMVLNGRFLGMVSADVDLEGNGLVDGQRFLDLMEPAVTRETLEALRQAGRGRERIPFEDLSVDGFSLAFSTASLELHATLGSAGMRATDMSLSGIRTVPDPTAFDQPARFSAGANISLGQAYRHNLDDAGPLHGAIDGIVQWGGFGGLTLITGADYDEGRTEDAWRRTETRLIKDFFGPAIRATVGEFTPLADGFQGSGRVVGIGVARAYSVVRPFQNVRPSGRQEFTLDREATVDVVINGLTRQTLRLQPGRYSLADFPFATGANQVQLVVDDITGRTELAVFDVFSGSELLGAGIVDFGLSVGQYEGSRSYEYDGPTLATGFVRKGISDSLTLGVNAQMSSDVQQVGGASILGSPWGLFLLEVAASQNQQTDEAGYAASISYRHLFSLRERDDLRITANAETISRYFADPFQPWRASPDSWRASALIQWNAPYEWGFTLGLSASRSRLSGFERHQVDVGVSRTFGRVSLTTNVSFSNDEDEDDVRFNIGLSVPLGGRWSSQARYDSGDNRSDVVLSRYSTGSLNDLSGEMRFTNDDRNRHLSGRLDYIHNRFEAQLVHNRLTDRVGGGEANSESSLSLRSFVGYAGGRFGLGRPVDDAFIIAPVHRSLAESDVRIRSGTRDVARSGLLGPPVIPIQRSYGVSSFNVEIDPLPVGYDIGSGVISVFPSFGVGYRQDIGSDASRIAIGVLHGPDGPLVLAHGTVEAIDREGFEPRVLFTNRAGRFVADALAPGDYRIIINGQEAARFNVPQTSEGVVDVGLLQARQGD